MSYAEDLLKQAEHLLKKEPKRPKQSSLRRGVSGAYYALFHHLIHEACTVLGRGNPHVRHLLARAFNHGEMKEAATRFATGQPKPAVAGKLPTEPFPRDLKQVAESFVELQEARHRADYDLHANFSRREATDLVDTARRSFEAWRRVRKTPMANAFLACLLVYGRIR